MLTTEPPAPWFQAAYDSVRERPDWITHTAATGHFLYEQAPELVVEILEEAI